MTDTTKKNNPNPQTVKKNQDSKSNKKKISITQWVLIVVSIIAIFSLIQGFFLSNIMSKKINQNTSQLTAIASQINAQANESKQLAQNIKQLSQAIKQSQSDIASNQQAVQALKQVTSTSHQNWRLIAVNHLLRMAQYHLRLLKQPAVALSILQQAQKQLDTMDGSEALQLRQLVLDVITQLKTLPKIDYAKVLIQLNAISKKVPSLSLINNLPSQPPTATIEPNDNNKATWKHYWHKTLAELEKLIIIRRQSKPIEPLISPQQQSFLIENLQLKLANTGVALLKNEQGLYTASLTSAIDWIKEYFAPTNARQSILDSLQQLTSINLEPTLPNLNDAIELSKQMQGDNS